ncbi:MAG: class I SAM-dependent methyltransferase [Burkholderiaceae bacterium]|nr:class I SAM-dependent methyltransferase [Burkholderiaceae bacterium]
MRSTLTAPFCLPQGAPAAARLVVKLLKSLRHGTLELRMPDGSHAHFGDASTADGPRAAISLRNWDVCSAALQSGDIGFAETYVAGHWTTPDLLALLNLFIANRDAVEQVIYGRWWGRLLHRVRHLLNRNSREGSKRNIHAHYDLGNAFYRLWLDETMNYSSALFDGRPEQAMADAQWAKVRRALSECGAGPDVHLLEIGCGWGALAECAAREFGARVTGVTLSSEQLSYGKERLAKAGLLDRAELRFQDYRDIPEPQFDAIVSIEMFEAVGRSYWPSFFATLRSKLKAGGRACIQTITIRGDLFERYASGSDFIQQYIFPGGMLPSSSVFHAEAAKAGLKVVNQLAFGADYAETLRRWRERFHAQDAAVRKLGFDDRFMRLWEFYLVYCEAAFASGNTDVVQFTLQHD